MISLVIKYGFIILCSVYTTVCLTNKRQTVTISRCTIRAFFLILQVAVAAYTRQYAMSISILTMVLSSAFIDKGFLKLDMSTAILATVIGYGTSYILFVGGILTLIAIKLLVGDYTDDISLVSLALVGGVQNLLSVLIFKTRRLRHGLPFLQNLHSSDLGIYLSILLLITAAIFGIKTEMHRTTITLFYLILSLGVLLWYWGKNYLTREYLNQVKKREQKDIQGALEEARREIGRLRSENETFSKIIHKDNKLIPAMELAVSQLLYSVEQDQDPQARTEQAQRILKQLKSLSEERTGILKNYEHTNQKLPSLGLGSLDALFLFMLQKAKISEIAFDLKVDDGILRILTGNISESDASTLLADLIENALIAANHGRHEKAVQVKLGIDAGIFYISVSDSGAPFPPEVLARWGIERITTHADAGGSGIGMMTIYELCQKYSASFEIEQVQNVSPYRKCVSVRFDGLGSFRVR